MPWMLAAQVAKQAINARGKLQQASDSSYSARLQEVANLRQLEMAENDLMVQKSSIETDRIQSQVAVGLNQKQAEANAELSAAASGSEGASVDIDMAMTDFNAAMKSAEINRMADMQTQQVVADLMNTRYQRVISTAKPPKIKGLSVMFGAGSLM